MYFYNISLGKTKKNYSLLIVGNWNTLNKKKSNNFGFIYLWDHSMISSARMNRRDCLCSSLHNSV